jgi:nicotinic acid mononucleotide adenylyltransferase
MMFTERSERRRYSAAVATLDDCGVLARLARAAASVEADDAPMAVALAGGQRLRAAQRVGLFAGSFNPLTWAHETLVDAAGRAAGLDAIVWVCAVASVDKERVARAALVDRLAQMRAFVAGRRDDALALLNRGLYVDEARLIRSLLAPFASLHILVGYDKVVQIFDPKYYANRDAVLRDLFALADLLVAPRGTDGADALAALLAEPQNRPFAGQVASLDVPDTYRGDSSTEARELAAVTPPEERALAQLLPPEGAALALHTGAYRTSPESTETADAYAIRVRWLDALASLPAAMARQLPPLSALVRQTMSGDARGSGLRAWLAARPARAATASARRRDAETLRSLVANLEG